MEHWVTGSGEEVTCRAAAFIIASAWDAVRQRGRFTLVIAGGSTPRSLYRELASGVDLASLPWQVAEPPAEALTQPLGKTKILMPWHHTLLFQGDERHDPILHAGSNRRMAQESLIRHINLPPENLFPMPLDSADPELDARRYEEVLVSVLAPESAEGSSGVPVFDLIILGMGGDGHTASLFPGDKKALEECKRRVIAVHAPTASPPGIRLTLTLPVINRARTVIFILPEERLDLARSIHEGKHPELPAAMVHPASGELYWFVPGGSGM